jgi:hypothetical protein
MVLPGRLRSTSLGDLLGRLHRTGATGTLELCEDRGRQHRIHFISGLVGAVELDGASPSLAEILRGDGALNEDVLRRSLLRAIASQRLHGEVLIDDFFVSPNVVGEALRRQIVHRLAVLERLADARVAFRVAVRPPRGALAGHRAAAGWDAPLGPQEFLRGRRRARERTGGGSREATSVPYRDPAVRAGDASAWEVLGLRAGAGIDEVKRAYRRLARTVHPDLRPDAGEAERRGLEARFAALTEAYRALIDAA